MAVANHYGARAVSGAENVIKQGYLKKCVIPSEPVPSTATQIATNIKQKLEPNRWYVFGVRYGTPYLEYFEKEESVFTGNALYTYNLSTYENLSYTMGRTNTTYSFCIYLTESTIELLAPNRAQMVDWCRCLERHLRNLGLKTKHAKDDHQYSEFPVKPKPPKKSEPPEPLEFFEAQAPPVVEEDHVYEEPPFKLEKNDNNNNSSDNGEPSPVLPPRIHSKKGSIPRNENENVFASLYSVNRPAAPGDTHGDLFDKNIDSIVITNRLNDAAGNSDSSDEDDGDILSIEDLALNRSRDPSQNHSNSSGLINKCLSLPAKVSIPTEVDTSEDSDFVTASFWLRNRVSDPYQMQDGGTVDKSQRELPPLPLDSVSIPPPLPVRKDSKFPSSVMARSTSPTGGSNLRRSPTLDLLGPAPTPFSAPQKIKPDAESETAKLVDINCDAETDIILPPRKTVKDSAIFSENKGVEKHDTKGGFRDDDGVYETLVDKSGYIVKAASDEKQVEEEEVYEAAWQGGDCKKGLKHSEELIVDLPKDKCDPGSKDEIHAKPKHKERKILSKLFSKKEIELPESLSVDLPSAQTKQNGHGTEEEDSNFYSDFPMKEHNSNPVLNVDSDILRIALENNPSFDPETSPVLPKRSFYRPSAHVSNQAKGSFSQSVTEPKTAVFFADENTYEEVDKQITVNKSISSPPSPPVKIREKPSHMLHNGVSNEIPIAPPRRNRKTICESDLRFLSENGKQKNMLTEELPPLPVRPDLNKIKTDSNEPAVPPRTYIRVESQRPAPPRPRLVPSNSVMSATDDQSRAGGARPKGGQLLGRQQSFQSSGLSVMNLKQNQADILKSEIESIGGMMRIIPKVHFQNGIAFVECFDRIWIAGWDVKRYPRLYDKFHVGDELISINDVHVTEMSFAQKLVKNVKADNIELTVRRLPNARVFAIQRSMEGESLGIKREGGTAEIVYVDPYGLASKSGLPTRSATIDNMGYCNWVLTEINMRPLNLFFKDQEIEHRLMAVGRDISIVVQPADFIKELKKQLKKLRNYKDFLVQ